MILVFVCHHHSSSFIIGAHTHAQFRINFLVVGGMCTAPARPRMVQTNTGRMAIVLVMDDVDPTRWLLTLGAKNEQGKLTVVSDQQWHLRAY